VLELLLKYNVLHFREFKKKLKADGKTIYRALDELVKFGLVKKEVEEPEKRTSKVYYSLTPFGKKAVKLYDYAKQLEQDVKDSPYFYVGNINGGNNIIIGNANNTHITLKK